MDSVQKFYLDDSFREEKETVSDDILNILDLFRLLSDEDKVKTKQLIREEKIWN